MATVREITAPLLHTYTTVLPVAAGVCSICHGAHNPGFATCYSCDQTRSQVTRPVQRVVPVSLYQHNSQLHTCLSQYKNSRVEQIRQHFQLQVAGMLGCYIDDHRACLDPSGAGWDAMVGVPSSTGRLGLHPLESAASLLDWHETFDHPLLRTAQPIGHNIAGDEGYEVIEPVADRRYLLVDDTFTTGARLQSAASALQIAGAIIVAALVLGRIVNPDFSSVTRTMWDKASAIPFTFDACCICR